MEDPEAVNEVLRGVPGIVETGIFLGYADYVVVGREKECKYDVLRFRRRAKAPDL